jgi:PKHD-type hydroxylase
MIQHLRNVLRPDELARLREIAARANFVDGRITNPAYRLKNNQQIAQDDPANAEPSRLLRDALFRHPDLQVAAFPRHMAMPTLSRYAPGMNYGWHMDAALFPSTPPMRSDVSCTVFLSEPDEYDGGELLVTLGQHALPCKLPAGDAVLYPATTIHQVAPVTRGVRLVGITWMQSFIPDVRHRELLQQIEEARAIETARGADANTDPAALRMLLLLGALRNNLFRLWSDA